MIFPTDSPAFDFSNDAGKWTYIEFLVDQELDATAWAVLPDAPLTNSEKTLMTNYRAALMNLTDSAATPDAIVWPTAPAGLKDKKHKRKTIK